MAFYRHDPRRFEYPDTCLEISKVLDSIISKFSLEAKRQEISMEFDTLREINFNLRKAAIAWAKSNFDELDDKISILEGELSESKSKVDELEHELLNAYEQIRDYEELLNRA